VVFAKFGAEMNQTVRVIAKPGRKHLMLPVVVFLFLVSYGLLTMLVVFEDRTIGAQADLIHLLFKESRRLTAIVWNQPSAAKQQQAKDNQRTQAPPAAVPGIQVPSTQVQQDHKASEIPSSQEKGQASAKPGKNRHKTGKRSPFRPPDEMTDPSDMRRTLVSI
jgi:hypothetical protein